MIRAAITLALAGLHGVPVVAAEATDTQGYVPAPLSVLNRTGAPLACRAVIAHWYLNEYGPAAAGRTLDLPLRFHSASGTVSILNTAGDEMAVERVLCGPVDAVYDTGTDLAYKALAATGRRQLACENVADEIVCN